jgi:hypothetical protein
MEFFMCYTPSGLDYSGYTQDIKRILHEWVRKKNVRLLYAFPAVLFAVLVIPAYRRYND